MSAISPTPTISIFTIVLLFALFLLAASGFVRALDRWLDRFNQVRQIEDPENRDGRD